jgi:hypothetical protein
MACWLRGLLNGCLLLLLLAQGFLLGTLWHWGFWSVPSWVVTPLLKSWSALEGRNVTAAWDFLRIYPRKGIHASQLQIFADECPCPVFRIADFRLSFVPGNNQNQPIHYFVNLRGGTLFFPDPFLPEQANLRLLEDLSLNVALTADKLTVQNLRGKIARVGFFSERPLEVTTEHWKSIQDRAEGDPEDSARLHGDQILSRLEYLRSIHRVCQQLEDANIALSPEIDPGSGISLAIQSFADSWRPADGSMVARGLILDGSVTRDREGRSRVESTFAVSKLEHKSGVEASHLRATLNFPLPLLDNPLPALGTLTADQVHGWGVSSSGLALSATRTGEQTLHIAGWTSVSGEALALDVSTNLKTGDLDLSLSGDGDLMHLIAAVGRADTPGIRLTRFDQNPLFAAGARIRNWTHPESAWFEVVGKGVSFKGAHFQYARTRGRWQGDVLTLEEFAASNPAWMIHGSLLEDFATEDYRYQIRGTGFPADLDRMFRPWWTELWEPFEFGSVPVEVNLDIQGRTGDPLKRLVFGSVVLEDTSFRGFRVDRGRVRLHAIPKCFRLYDLYLEHPRGLVSGAVTTVYHPEHDSWVTRHLHLDTVIPLNDLLPFTGQALVEIAANTRTEQAPLAEIRGVIVNEGYSEFGHLDVLHIAVDVPGHMVFYDFHIEDFRSRIVATSHAVTLDPIQFRFASGEGSGNVRLERNPDPPLLHFDLAINGMDYRLAASCVPQKSGSNPSSSPESDPLGQEPDLEWETQQTRSSTDIAMKGSFPLGNRNGLVGSGSFTLEDPLIHRVHLLGGLSKLLSSIDLNLGSFALKQASSDLRLEGPVVFFDDLVLTGPSSRVAARGTWNMDDSSLDFRLKAYPLREARFPVIAGLGLILRPVSQLFAVRLTGTLDKPDWQIVVDARNL